MRLLRGLCLALVVLPILSFPIYAKADSLVYGLSESQDPTVFSAGGGVAEGVFANQTMTIDAFGFDLKQLGGGTVNYFIVDATAGTLLLGPTDVTAPSAIKAFTYLENLDLTLTAGDLYYFGVFGDSRMTVNLDPTAFFGNGLSLATGAPTSFEFSIPGLTITPAGGVLNQQGFDTDDASLRVFSNAPPSSVTPEPSSLIMLGTGILAAAGAMRKRLMA
jgi:hypothetical protein